MLSLPFVLSCAALFLVRYSSPPWALMAFARMSFGLSSAARAAGANTKSTTADRDNVSRRDMAAPGLRRVLGDVMLFGTRERVFLVDEETLAGRWHFTRKARRGGAAA